LEIILCYADGTAFFFLSRKDIEEAKKLIKLHFTCFGLTAHSGDVRQGDELKIEAMFTSPTGKTTTATG
jgi:hypothetical protein